MSKSRSIHPRGNVVKNVAYRPSEPDKKMVRRESDGKMIPNGAYKGNSSSRDHDGSGTMKNTVSTSFIMSTLPHARHTGTRKNDACPGELAASARMTRILENSGSPLSVKDLSYGGFIGDHFITFPKQDPVMHIRMDKDHPAEREAKDQFIITNLHQLPEYTMINALNDSMDSPTGQGQYTFLWDTSAATAERVGGVELWDNKEPLPEDRMQDQLIGEEENELRHLCNYALMAADTRLGTFFDNNRDAIHITNRKDTNE